jgi:aspartate carbamoyltransferase catalytic subunit
MANPLYQKHIISINDLSREDLELVLATAAKLKANPQPELLKHKVIASCFFEASTRTRLSFETSMHRLGASVVGFSDSSNTSLGKKGETLADTISVISTYVDAIVMRHPQEGRRVWRPSFPAVFRYSTPATALTSTRRRPCWISSPFRKLRAVWKTSTSRWSAT